MTREALPAIRNFKVYLYVLSRNHALNAVRKIVRERNRKLKFEKKVADESGHAEEIYSEEQLAIVDRAIEALPEQQRKVFRMSRLEGLTYEEIAERMQISRETVKYYMKLAIESVSRFIRDHLQELPLIFILLFLKNFPN